MEAVEEVEAEGGSGGRRKARGHVKTKPAV